MKNKGIGILVGASCAAVLALGGASAGTFALFSRNLDTTTHVKVGNINFRFSKIKEVKKVLADDGTLKDVTDTNVVDLTTSGSKAIDVSTIAPGSEITSTFKLENTGGVAFSTVIDYLNVEVYENNTKQTENAWLEYVTLTTKVGSTVKNDVKLNSKIDSTTLGNVKKGESLEFIVNLKFDGSNIGNEAQNKELKFDVKLTCTQITSLE